MSAAAQLASTIFPDSRAALLVVGSARMRALNRGFRDIDEPTDVLSFPATEGAPAGHAGDIALCWDAVIKQAAAHGHSPAAEATALIAHALLHLAGWDHADEASAAAMDARTIELCKTVGFEVAGFGH